MTRSRRSPAPLSVILLLALSGCGDRAPARTAGPSHPHPRPNVLLITIDTLRADRLGRGFTPALDRLAGGGLAFTQARTPVPLTLPSHATILSGLLPGSHGVRENGTYRFSSHPTLATILKGQGYTTAAAVGAFVLARQFGLDAGFDTYSDAVRRSPDASTQLEAERPAAAVTDAALAALAGMRTSPAGGFFLWTHYYDPHAPYTPPAEHRARAGGDAYNGEIAYVDAEVRRLLDALRRHDASRGRETLVAVAGDHGEGLGEHGESTHGMLLYDATLRVPLIFARLGADAAGTVGGPAGAAAVRPEPVSLADVAPTLLAALGIAPPARLDGVNLLQAPARDREIYAETQYPRVAGWSPLTALIAEGRKLIRGGRTRLFELAGDPGEARDVAPARSALVAAMEARLRTLSADTPSTGAVLTSDARDRLRALGYVASAPAPTQAGAAPDPADRIGDWNAFETASADLPTARRRAAVSRLRELAARNPNAQAFQTTVARALGEDGRHAEALRAYRQAAARWPADSVLLHDLAVAARAAGQPEEALRAEQAALAVNPDDPAALNGLGLLHVDGGRFAEAAVAFERAVALTRSDPSYYSNLGNARRALGNAAGARQAFEAALAQDDSWPDAANGLAVLLVQEAKPSEAIAWLEKALARSPGFVEARLNLGIACQEAGRTDCARESYRAVLSAGAGHEQDKKAARVLLKGVER